MKQYEYGMKCNVPFISLHQWIEMTISFLYQNMFWKGKWKKSIY